MPPPAMMTRSAAGVDGLPSLPRPPPLAAFAPRELHEDANAAVRGSSPVPNMTLILVHYTISKGRCASTSPIEGPTRFCSRFAEV